MKSKLLIVLGALAAFAAAGCSTVDSRIAKNRAAFNTWPPAVQDKVVLGQIDMRLSGGLGVRIDNRGDTSQWTRNVRIDTVYVSGAGSHAVETYGVDGITIGTVTARNVGESGLLLNQTIANQGLYSTQMLGVLFDGIARHTPEGHAFVARSMEVGFRQAMKERDEPFGDAKKSQ